MRIVKFAVTLAVAWSASIVSAEEIAFQVDPSRSRVDLTAFGLVQAGVFTNEDVIASTRDTQTMPIGGEIILDVEIAAGQVLSVDFVSLRFDYLNVLESPTVYQLTSLFPDPFSGTPPGVDSEVRLPFDPEVASGNPTTPLDPTLTLDAFDAGDESGSDGELSLNDPIFRFQGTAQSFGDSSTSDGFPLNFGPYPNGVNVTELPPADRSEVAFDPDGGLPQFPVTPAPSGPNLLDGVVSIVGNALVFDGSFFTFGAGGGGTLVYPQIHDGRIFASTATLSAGDFNGDGAVDGADFLQWQRGESPNPLSQTDLIEWETNFPAIAAKTAAATVPEPGSLVSGLLAALAIVRWRADRRRLDSAGPVTRRSPLA